MNSGDPNREPPSQERLEGWKEIAGYLQHSVRAVQRWQPKGLPVYRHQALGTVYAYKSELDSWLKARPAEDQEAAHPPVPAVDTGAAVAHGEHLRKRIPRSIWILIVCAASLGVTGVVVMTVRKSKEAPAEQLTRPSLAVIGFRNLSGGADGASLSAALTEMFRTELAVSAKLRSISGEDVARMKRELSLPATDSFSKDTLARIRKDLDSDIVLMGSYVRLGNDIEQQIRLNVVLQDTRNGETVAAVSETGSNLFQLVTLAGGAVRQQLGLGERSASEMVNLNSARPHSLEAQRLYAEGLESLRGFEAGAARDYLARAIQAEPNYALAHSMLADAWAALGYEASARKEAQIALGLSAGLSPEEALFIEAKYQEWANEWDRAIEIYRRLQQFSRDRLDYRLRLAKAQIAAGKSREALVTLAQTRELSTQLREDPRIDLAEALTAESLGDFKREEAAAAQAAKKGEWRGARLLVAQAQLRECWAFFNLGEPEQAIERADRARRAFASVGDRAGEAQALKNTADVVDDQGNHVRAAQFYGKALAIFREIGYETGLAVTLNNLAYALQRQGDLAGAKKMFEESLAVSQKISDRGREALALNGVAIVLWRQGDLSGAKRMFEEALRRHLERNDRDRASTVLGNLAIILQDEGSLAEARSKFEESLAMLRQIDDRRGQARTLGNIGELLIKQGDLTEAKKRFEEQLAIGRAIPEDRQCAYALYGLGEVLLSEGDIKGARASHEQALALRTKMGEKGLVAESKLALAQVSLEEANPFAAESAAREATQEFRTESEIDEEAYANAVLALALVAERKDTQAQNAIRVATEQSSKSEDRAVRLLTAITIDRVRASSGQTAQVMKDLQSSLREAMKHGYLGYQLEARLALGEADMTAGTPEARTRLEALEKDARSTGFGLIARKAASALSAKPAQK